MRILRVQGVAVSGSNNSMPRETKPLCKKWPSSTAVSNETSLPLRGAAKDFFQAKPMSDAGGSGIKAELV